MGFWGFGVLGTLGEDTDLAVELPQGAPPQCRRRTRQPLHVQHPHHRRLRPPRHPPRTQVAQDRRERGRHHLPGEVLRLQTGRHHLREGHRHPQNQRRGSQAHRA